MPSPERAVKILQDDGFLSLMRRSGEFVCRSVVREASRAILSGRIVTRDDVTDGAVSGSMVWTEEPEPEIKLSRLKNGSQPTSLEKYRIGTAKSFISEFINCRVVGPHAAVFTQSGELVLESVGGDKERFYDRLETIMCGKPIRTICGGIPQIGRYEKVVPTEKSAVFPLVPFFNQYYYHWIVQYLPKLRMLEQYEKDTGKQPELLVENDAPAFVNESLDLLGYPERRRREWRQYPREFDTVVLTNFKIHNPERYFFEHSRRDYEWLRRRLHEATDQSCGEESSEFGQLIYISRQKAERGRKVTNYGPMMELLSDRGFQSVTMEELSMAEQVKLIKDAKAVVGPHGAGLVNVIFGKDLSVLEILPDKRTYPNFFLLSDIMKHDYVSIVAESEDGGGMKVDLNVLGDRLSSLEH